MKKIQRSCAALSLALLFALPCFAGDMQTGIVQPSPTPPAATGTSETTPSTNTIGPDPGNLSSTTDLSTEVMVTVLTTLMSLF